MGGANSCPICGEIVGGWNGEPLSSCKCEREKQAVEVPTCGLCRDCKWWNNAGWHGIEGQCNSSKMNAMFIDPVTVADFGCTEWEAKE